MEESLPIAASGSEKMRSEGIIYPVLLEVRRILNKKVNLFSGEEFTVDESVGLNGVCDFLIIKLLVLVRLLDLVLGKSEKLSAGFW